MSKSFKKDLTGQRFGRLTVIEFVPRPDDVKHSYWLCRCDCGNEVVPREDGLKSGRVLSCGCFQKEMLKKRAIERNYKHGGTETRLYKIWAAMKARCHNPNSSRYKNYGGRGITVCEEWKKDFTAFRDWALANGYRDDLTIDRIDVNGNYEPSNCRWVTMKVQNRNRRSNIVLEYNGAEMCLTDIAQLLEIKRHVLQGRYNRGDRGERLFRPLERKKKN